MQQISPRARFSRLPRVRPGAETGRFILKSILIGAPIPYAERPSAGHHGEAAGGTAEPTVLLLRSYLAQDKAPIGKKQRRPVPAKNRAGIAP